MIGPERTVADAARALELPERTLRRYLAAYRAWVPVRHRGRLRLLGPEALEVLRQVRALHDDGRTVPEVLEHLADSGAPVLVDSSANPGGVLARRDDVAGMAAELARLREGIGLLVNAVERQSRELEHLRAEVLELRAAPPALPESAPTPEENRLRAILERARGRPVTAEGAE